MEIENIQQAREKPFGPTEKTSACFSIWLYTFVRSPAKGPEMDIIRKIDSMQWNAIWD